MTFRVGNLFFMPSRVTDRMFTQRGIEIPRQDAHQMLAVFRKVLILIIRKIMENIFEVLSLIDENLSAY